MRTWVVAVSAAVVMAAGTARAVEHGSTKAAAAADVKLADDVWNGEGRFSGLDYATSDRFGRAWVVLHYTFQAPCRDSEGECEQDAPRKVSVPGLTYDPARKQVVYEREGMDPVTCAATRKGFLGLGEALAATGNCTTHVVKVDRFLDDGFAGRQDRREEVHLAVEGR